MNDQPATPRSSSEEVTRPDLDHAGAQIVRLYGAGNKLDKPAEMVRRVQP